MVVSVPMSNPITGETLSSDEKNVLVKCGSATRARKAEITFFFSAGTFKKASSEFVWNKVERPLLD